MSITEDYLKAYRVDYGDVEIGWRKIGALYKAKHIFDLCEANGIKPRRILEYGAGTGAILEFLSEWKFANEYYAVEINPQSCSRIRSLPIQGLKQVKQFDGYNTEFGSGYFDLVILSHVLEHVEFERLVLREMKRIAKYQIIEVPLDYSHNVDEKADHFMSYGHINVYKPGLLRFLLKTEGYEVLDGIVNLMEEPVRAYKVFNLDKSMSDTPENRVKIKEECIKKQLEFESMPLQQKELWASDYTVLCKSSATPISIMK